MVSAVATTECIVPEIGPQQPYVMSTTAASSTAGDAVEHSQVMKPSSTLPTTGPSAAPPFLIGAPNDDDAEEEKDTLSPLPSNPSSSPLLTSFTDNNDFVVMYLQDPTVQDDSVHFSKTTRDLSAIYAVDDDGFTGKLSMSCASELRQMISHCISNAKRFASIEKSRINAFIFTSNQRSFLEGFDIFNAAGEHLTTWKELCGHIHVCQYEDVPVKLYCFVSDYLLAQYCSENPYFRPLILRLEHPVQPPADANAPSTMTSSPLANTPSAPQGTRRAATNQPPSVSPSSQQFRIQSICRLLMWPSTRLRVRRRHLHHKSITFIIRRRR